jgi:hypothetical protein
MTLVGCERVMPDRMRAIESLSLARRVRHVVSGAAVLTSRTGVE